MRARTCDTPAVNLTPRLSSPLFVKGKKYEVHVKKINAAVSSLVVRALDSGHTGRPGDEAHFWLNGYVNKQNYRIWSEANPQVYVETPLHPEKLTVWCALWAGGVLLQKR
ncbi:hypothetical protein TNCV_1144791 [Trichonephila clavipes]|nr:hypothetical protein TNCV_1144791 [Trichonephila clavipes]